MATKMRSLRIPDDLWESARSAAQRRGEPLAALICRGMESELGVKTPGQAESGDVLAFAQAVLHGDPGHRAWLLGAAKSFLAGEPLPAPPAPVPAPVPARAPAPEPDEDEEEVEDEEEEDGEEAERVTWPPAKRAAYPPGFEMLHFGSAAWYRGDWVYAFPESRKANWIQAIRMIEEIGNPDESDWGGVPHEIQAWLQPRRKDE